MASFGFTWSEVSAFSENVVEFLAVEAKRRYAQKALDDLDIRMAGPGQDMRPLRLRLIRDIYGEGMDAERILGRVAMG